MRILFHDYGRYPFLFELTQQLAARRHHVTYTFSAADSARCDARESLEYPSLSVVRLGEGGTLKKDSLLHRYKAEEAHAARLVRLYQAVQPDVVLSANSPLVVQERMLRACEAHAVPFVFWVQDLLGDAARRLLPRKLPGIGHYIGWKFHRLEKRLVRRSARCIAISNSFAHRLNQWGVPAERVLVQPNWAPSLPVASEEEKKAWRQTMELTSCKVALYSGTLGMKHSPEMLLDLAKSLAPHGATVLVVAEGSGADWLKQQDKPDNLLVRSFLPYEQMSVALQSADVLLALLENEAGEYCVPSKVLTYMQSRTPIVAAMPLSNEAAHHICETASGCVVPAGDSSAFASAVLQNLSTPRLCAMAARSDDGLYDLTTITTRIESLLSELVPSPEATNPTSLQGAPA